MGTFYGFQNNLDSPSLTKVFLSFPIGNLSNDKSLLRGSSAGEVVWYKHGNCRLGHFPFLRLSTNFDAIVFSRLSSVNPCTHLFFEMSQIPSSARCLLSCFETELSPFSKVSRRPISRDSLLESESQFLAVNDPTQMLPIEQMSLRPKQSSARERRRWKQLEEMARNPKVKLFSFPRLSCKLLE